MFIIFIMFALYFSLLIQETASMCDTFIVFFLYVLLFEVSLTCLSIGILIELFADSFDWFAIFFFKDKVLVINALSIIKKNAPMQRYWSSFVFLPNCFLYLNLNTGGIFMGESTHKINHRVPVNILFCYVNQCHCICSHTCSSFRYIFETIAKEIIETFEFLH